MSVEGVGNDIIESEVIIYPNPTSDILNIKLRNQDIKKVILYSISGKLLKEFDKNIIDLKNINTGVYLIKIFTNSNNIINSKIIKK